MTGAEWERMLRAVREAADAGRGVTLGADATALLADAIAAPSAPNANKLRAAIADKRRQTGRPLTLPEAAAIADAFGVDGGAVCDAEKTLPRVTARRLAGEDADNRPWVTVREDGAHWPTHAVTADGGRAWELPPDTEWGPIVTGGPGEANACRVPLGAPIDPADLPADVVVAVLSEDETRYMGGAE